MTLALAVPQWLTTVGPIAGLFAFIAGIVAALVVFGYRSKLKEAIQTWEDIDKAKTARIDQLQGDLIRMSEESAQCKTELATVKGQIKTLESVFSADALTAMQSQLAELSKVIVKRIPPPKKRK